MGAGWIGKTLKALEHVAVVCLIGISVTIFAQILLRNLFSIGFPWADELSRFMHITLIFLTVPVLFRENAHVKIDLFVRSMSPRKKGVIGIFSILVCLFFGLAFLYSEFEFMRGSWDVPTPAMRMPNLFFFSGVILGMAVFLLTVLEKLILQIKDIQKKSSS